ncbi:MAG: EamA family transporter [Geminicoccaceae bacterium]
MELWIPISIAAAFLQNVRSSLQRHLKASLSTTGATFSRFAYAAPLAALYAFGLAAIGGFDVPRPNAIFFASMIVGGVSQILATALLIALFSFRNFAVGTTFSKTETIQTAIFGIVILGETLSSTAVIAILISLFGVFTISTARTPKGLAGLISGLTDKAALIGIASGAFFGISAVSYRAASLSLGGEGFLMQASFTLAAVTLFQTALMAIYMRWREPGQMTAVLKAWRVAGLVGLSGMLASLGWFTAMTIQNAAYVRALGQVELIFTFASSYLIFGERSNRSELIGIGLVIAGILILLLV